MTIAYLCLQATREGQASHAHVHEIIAGLKRAGHVVKLFEPRYADPQLEPPGPIGRLVEMVAVQRRLLKGGPYDVVYVRSHFAALLASWWGRRTGVPVVQELNGPYEDVFLAWPASRAVGRLLIASLRLQLKWANAVITVTPQLVNWVERETGRADARVISNGANTDLFHPEREPTRPLPKRYVVFFGALSPWQGVPDLLAAVQSSRWPAGVALVIVGDGIQRKEVEKEADGQRVVYLGRLPYEEMGQVVAGSLAGLVPKTNLGDRQSTGLNPLKVFETLACGVPAVVTDFPGQADLVRDHDCGIVVSPGAPTELAAAVAELAADPERARAMGSRGRAAVLLEHSWARRAADTEALLCAIVN